MSSGRRRLLRTVAATLFLLAEVALLAVPAEAAERGPDLVVDASGTRITLGVDRKVVYLKISNRGDETPGEVIVNVRQPPEGPDPMPVALLWHTGSGVGECDGDFGGFYCRLLPELIPGPGETVDVPIDAFVRGTAPYESRFEASLTVRPEQDANPADNTRWFPLTLVDEPSADLSVVARDVRQSVRVGADGIPEPTGTLNPGETGAVWHTIANQGRKTVTGVRVTLRLPKGVTFTRQPAQCVLGDARRSAVCTYRSLTLVPAAQDTDPNDAVHSAVELYNLVTTATSATAPATIRGGSVRVEGLAEQATNDRSAPASAELPANAVAVRVADVDPGDNQDGFAVVLVASSGGDTGGGDGNGDGGDGGGGGGDGGLPVTGPQAGLVGGIGIAALTVGGVLLLATRRRRTILVIPEGASSAEGVDGARRPGGEGAR
ncbi:hypothetical protein O7634_18475 [Micromonospora sp. WMMD1120]|uniref:hypothetical protein n=1 Tax=Micromonospora sp. WMMD1120 TaxID=3016106 RepID=UPI002416597E|nr:hypothetical protein [Micromonospora sp. WMMD1120]MDG4808735.1 hypothetical protein [Micromonospora sp. WMMD1120]